MSHCALCRLVSQAKKRRVFEETDRFVIAEHMGTMAPVLVAKNHGPMLPTLDAFRAVKKVSLKLFGDDFSLSQSLSGSDHFAIKVIRLKQAT